MGRQSQLGPIDPQFVMGQRAQSARAIVDQFEQAKSEILQNAAAAGAWFPILQTVGPALLQEARNALDYRLIIVPADIAKVGTITSM